MSRCSRNCFGVSDHGPSSNNNIYMCELEIHLEYMLTSSNMAEERDLVRSLTNLVNAAKEVAKVSSPEPEVEEDVDSRLKNLYPSTRGRPTTTGAGSSRDAAGSATTKSYYNNNSNSISSRRGFFSKKRFSKKDATVPVKKKCFQETLKYIFLLPNPSSSVVPRRKAREYFYRNNLVASAVRFGNTMSETDIRVQIACKFEQYPFLDYEFMKAVDETLVCPNNIETWDYAILKHVTGQGPLYIRSKLNLKIKDILKRNNKLKMNFLQSQRVKLKSLNQNPLTM